jgi:hypothetical protein
MGMFRKKPVVVEASQWFKNGDHPKDGDEVFDSGRYKGQRLEGKVVRYFCAPDVPGALVCPHCGKPMLKHGWIDTPEGGRDGAQVVCPGDWIITGIKGEFYPCKPDIFEATYEAA